MPLPSPHTQSMTMLSRLRKQKIPGKFSLENHPSKLPPACVPQYSAFPGSTGARDPVLQMQLCKPPVFCFHLVHALSIQPKRSKTDTFTCRNITMCVKYTHSHANKMYTQLLIPAVNLLIWSFRVAITMLLLYDDWNEREICHLPILGV